VTSANQYWAAVSRDDIGGEIVGRAGTYYNATDAQGLQAIWRRSYRRYYGLDDDNGYHKTSVVSRGGSQGELTQIAVNHFRNLLQHILVMATSQRPAWDARGINGDYETLAQAELAQCILDYYLREKKLERIHKQAVEFGLLFGEGFVRVGWDPNAGEVVDYDQAPPGPDGVAPEPTPIHAGDIDYQAFSPWDVLKDPYRDPERIDWYILRTWHNKYDLVARYPDLEDAIMSSDSLKEGRTYTPAGSGFLSTDDVAVYEFFHAKTPALPEGRHALVVGSGGVLFDGSLPYEEVPVYRFAPAPFVGSSFGYSPGFDLIGLQDMIDGLYSAIASNNAAFAVQNIVVEDGTDIGVEQVVGGLNLVRVPRGAAPPMALQLTATPPETFGFAQQLVKDCETISGVNSVARGNPESSLKSGTALALVQAQAVQFNSGTSGGSQQLLEDIGTATVQVLKAFASAPRFAAVVGKDKRSLLREFTGADLARVSRVIVDSGNALSRTLAGRSQIAEQFLQQGIIKDPQQYLEVLTTGRLEPTYEGPRAEMMLIRSENERLMRGEGAPVLRLDAHELHIQEHRIVLANPQIRTDANVVGATLKHIAEHEQLMAQAIAAQQPQAPPQQGGQAPQQGGGASPPSQAELQQPGAAPPPAAAQMPMDPMTGERVLAET
jgi:hypothetical protein